MNYTCIDHENIETEHICCAISDKKGDACMSSKKAWMKRQFDNGLVSLNGLMPEERLLLNISLPKMVSD